MILSHPKTQPPTATQIPSHQPQPIKPAKRPKSINPCSGKKKKKKKLDLRTDGWVDEGGGRAGVTA